MELSAYNLYIYKTLLEKKGLSEKEITQSFKGINIISIFSTRRGDGLTVGQKFTSTGLQNRKEIIIDNGYSHPLWFFIKKEYSMEDMEMFKEHYGNIYSDTKELIGIMKDSNEKNVKLYDTVFYKLIKAIKEMPMIKGLKLIKELYSSMN